jgi:hypothetical protein
MLWLAFSGVGGYDLLDWMPDELAQDASEAETRIQTNEVLAADLGVDVIDYEEQAEWIKYGVKDTLYKTMTKWQPSEFPDNIKRGEPTLFALTDLRAEGGIGAIMQAPEEGAGRGGGMMGMESDDMEGYESGMGGSMSSDNLEGKRWICVTGLIPVEDQLEAYMNVFSNSLFSSRNPGSPRDMPLYSYYRIERNEEGNVDANGDPIWEELPVSQALHQADNEWAGYGMEVVSPEYLAPEHRFPMAFPIPPLANKRLDDQVAHPPEIPLLSDELLQQLEKQESTLEKIENAELREIDDLLEDDDPFANGAGRRGMPGMTGMGSDYESMEDDYEGYEGGGMGMGMGSGRSRQGRRSWLYEEVEMEQELMITVSHYLFRYFDMDVEPGKTYRYRAKLYLANPNFKLQEKYLEDPALAEEKYLSTEYSEASSPASVPLDTRILAMNVRAPVNPDDEPVGKVMAIYFDMEDGTEAPQEKESIRPGRVANWRNQTKKVKQPNNMGSDFYEDEGMYMDDEYGSSTASSRNTPREETKIVDFTSDVTVLDMLGGERVSGTNPDQRSPGKFLVMEPSGALSVRSTAEDYYEYKDYLEPEVPERSDEYEMMDEGYYPD